MANAFDQFDAPDTPSPGPVKITVPGGAPKASTNGAAQANPFDTFDPPAETPKESLPDFAGRMATNLGIGAVQGAVSLPETPGALLDLIPAAAGMRSLGTQDEPAPGVNLADQDRAFSQFMAQQYGAPDPNLPNGYADDVRSKGWKEFVAAGGAPAPRAPQQSMGAALNEAIRSGLKAVGLDFRSYFDPDQYFQPPKDDAEAYARTAGAMGVGMLLPGEWANAPTALGKLSKAGSEFATGAVGGMAGQKVAEGATNDQDRMALNALTMMGTGMAAHGVGKGLEAVGSQFGKVGDYLAPAVPWSNKRQIAANKIASYVGDPNAVASTLENTPEYVPGYKPTAAKASGDAHLDALERSLARNDDSFNASLLNRQAENNARLTGTFQDVAEQGSPAAAAEYFTARMRELEDRANALYDQHAAAADQHTQALGDTPEAADIGQRARAAMQGNFKTLNDQANRLWNSLPDDMTVPTAPITAVRDSIYKGMSPEDALSVQPIEHAIAGIIDDYGPDLTFDRFKRLRSRLTTAMREMARDGKGEARGRLSQLLNGVEEAMGQSITERAAQDQQAVAAGRMAPEDALANRFLNDAKQAEAGDVAAPGNAVPEAASASAVPRDTGAAGAAERGPASAAGAEGFPRDAGNIAGEGPYPARNLNEDTNGRPNPAAPVARSPLQSAEPRPASGPGEPGGAGVRQVPGKPAREGDGSLAGLPRKVGTHTASGWPEAQRVARDYMDKAGLEYDPPNTYAKVDPERAKRIADAYEAMKHDPQNPEVKAAYDAMAKETLAQYQAILDSGMTFDFIPEGFADPYNGNPRNMIEDVRTHKHMWVFPTKQGFGSDASFDVRDNPLLADSGFKISGQPATVNDIFRAVHDYFGHVKEGVGFRADGEENAWRAHSAMYSPEARKAMTSETRGQNSWVNYGPYGEANRTARSEDTHYADQKIGILPDWVIHEGANDEQIARPSPTEPATPKSIGDQVAYEQSAAGRPTEEANLVGRVVDAAYRTFAKWMGRSPDEIAAEIPAPTPAKRIGAGEVEQYKKARAATLNLKETFGPRPVKDILKRPGSGYAYDMPDENVAGKLWRAGPEGGGQVKQIINAAGNTPEIKQAVTEAAVTSLKSKAMKNGRLDPELLSKWRTQHASALSSIPDLGPKLNSVEGAERALAQIGQRRADAIKAVQKTAIGKLLNVTADADVSRTLGSMLNGREAVKSMRELMAEAKKDPNAVAGLQSALAQHMLEKLGSSRGGFRPDTYQRYLGKVAPALSQVLSPEQMNSFRAVAQELKREQRDVRAPGGGSDTAQNLAAARRFGLEKPTLLGRLWSSIGAPVASGAAAAVGLSPGGWMMQTISSLGAAIGTHVIQQAREAGMETVMDFVKQAMLDPQMMAELLKSATVKPNTGSQVSLATYLAKAATASARQSEDKKRRGFADGGTVATDGGDVYTSPPAWAAPIVAKLISDASNGGKIAGVIPNQPSGVI